MDNVSTIEATDALRLLADAALDRQNDLSVFEDITNTAESDEDEGSPSPIYDSFYRASGSAAIADMINFSPKQFHSIWNKVSAYVIKQWNVGKDRKSSFRPKDVLFMMMTVLKHGTVGVSV